MQESCKISCFSCFTGFTRLLNFTQGYRTGPVLTGNRTLLQGFIQDRMPSLVIEFEIFQRILIFVEIRADPFSISDCKGRSQNSILKIVSFSLTRKVNYFILLDITVN
jgi:hypothetical protein